MYRPAAMLAAVATTVSMSPVVAQPAPLEEDAGNRPVDDDASADKTPPPSPRLHLHTDDAGIGAYGWLGVDAHYQAAFHPCFGSNLSAEIFAEDKLCTFHTPTVMATFAPVPWLETRLGLQAFGASGYPDYIWLSEPTIVDRVDLLLEVKAAIPLDIEEPERHQLAVLATVRPGAGYSWPRERGGVVGGYAIYSTRPGPVHIDVQAGLKLRGLFRDPSLAMPLSAAISWRALSWLEPYGEFIEELDFRDLSASQTSIRLGTLFWVEPRFAISAGTQIGLSETIADGTIELGLTTQAARILR